MHLTLDEIAGATGGRLEGSGAPRVRGYSIDSRSIGAGELFVAIRGPRFDGHDFLADAARRGAAGALVSSAYDGSGVPLPSIRVDSPDAALGMLARAVRRRWGRPLVAVTGSAGKTTTKEMVADLLSARFQVLRSTGNFNNAYGLPLCLLRLEPHHEIAVLEMGMSARGEIRQLAEIAEPNEGVITNVAAAHLEFFKSVDEIAEAKAELIEGLTGARRRAYLNNDDSRVRAMARRFHGEIVTFGVRSLAAFRVVRAESRGLAGTAFTIRHGRRMVDFLLPLPGSHNVFNAAAAIAVARTHGLEWEEIQDAMKKLSSGPMRGAIVRLRDGITLIDDSYNSNPKALNDMVRFLAELPGSGRRILVAGEMLELGEGSRGLHQASGRDAARAGIDLIVGVRGDAEALVEGAREAGAADSRLRFLPDAAEAGDFLVRTVRPGDVVLLKASRGVHLEQAVQALKQSFSTEEP